MTDVEPAMRDYRPGSSHQLDGTMAVAQEAPAQEPLMTIDQLTLGGASRISLIDLTSSLLPAGRVAMSAPILATGASPNRTQPATTSWA